MFQLLKIEINDSVFRCENSDSAESVRITVVLVSLLVAVKSSFEI